MPCTQRDDGPNDVNNHHAPLSQGARNQPIYSKEQFIQENFRRYVYKRVLRGEGQKIHTFVGKILSVFLPIFFRLRNPRCVGAAAGGGDDERAHNSTTSTGPLLSISHPESTLQYPEEPTRIQYEWISSNHSVL